MSEGPSRPAPDEEAARADLTNDSVRTHSWMLGKAFVPAAGLRVSPYLEVGTVDMDPRLSGRSVTSTSLPPGHLLFGAVARYSLAPHWALSLDFAAGVPLMAGQEDNPRLASPEGDDDGPGSIWRTGLKLGYTLGKDFNAFATAEFGSVRAGLTPELAGTSRFGSEATEAALHLGFSYKFQ